MKRFLDDIDPDPVLVTDERVVISQEMTINETTYYEGELFGSVEDRIHGSQADVGAWTETGKGGTQYDVIFEGLPGASEVLLDLNNSRVITNSSVTLYFRYYDFGREFKYFELGGELQIPIVGMVNCDSETTAYERTIDYPTRIVAGRVVGENSISIAAEDGVYFRVYNVDISSYRTISVGIGDREGSAIFSPPLELQRGDVLRITVLANSENFVNPRVLLQVG